MTGKDLYQILLAHAGKRLGASGSAGEIPPAMADYAVHAINSALELMRERAPRLFKRPVEAFFRGQRSGTVTVTNGGRSLTLGTLPAPEQGETIVIEGDPVWNEVSRIDGAYQLLHQFSGASGTRTATIYGDCVAIPDADAILGVPMMPGRRKLAVLASRNDWVYYSQNIRGDYEARGMMGPVHNRYVGTPEAVWLETWTHNSTIEYRLHCAPLPAAPVSMGLEVAVRLPEIVPAYLQSDNFVFVIPGGRDYTILRPLALWFWTECPYFAAPAELRKRLEVGYGQALASLESLRPHAEASGQVVVEGM